METQLLYVLSIVMAVGFGYFVASTMFRGERNSLINQGRQAADAERAELEEQVKLHQTRVAEIEKEREQERASIDKLRDENAKLHVLHSEADERVAEARRSTEEHWQTIVAEARLATGERTLESADDDNRPTYEQLEQAVAEARRASDEQWQQITAELRKEAAIELTAAEAGWQAKIDALTAELKEAREQTTAAAAPAESSTGHAQAAELLAAAEADWQAKIDALTAELREAREQAATAAPAESSPGHAQAAELLAAAEADWQAKIDALAAELKEAREQAQAREQGATNAAHTSQETEAVWQAKLDALAAELNTTREQAEASATLHARNEAEAERKQTAELLAAAEASWQAKFDSLTAERNNAREEAAVAAATHARSEVEAERAQAAQRLAEAEAAWQSKLDALHAELIEAREQAAAVAAAVTTAAPLQEAPRQEAPAPQAPSYDSMLEAFRSVAAEALHANNEKFLDLARVALDRIQETSQPQTAGYSSAVNELIDPIRETLAKVDNNLGQMERERQNAFANLTDLVNNLIQQGRDLRQETTGLARALRPANAHGRWGELQLRRVVELAGMLEHCDYEEQPAAENANAAQQVLRPEMVVHLPNHRDIVVDANVSLSAYLESLEAVDENARAEKLREHAAGVRAHLQRLSGGAYWSQFSSTPEFVVAFLPSETVFSAALEQDPALIEFGAENRVILATPTTLIALLKATAYGWQQQQLADNARAVSELGKTLYDRLANFTGHMDDLRRNLERSVDSYNRGVASFESRVLMSARRFHELASLDAPEIPALDPVETLPRSLHALESATVSDAPRPASIPAPTHRQATIPVPVLSSAESAEQAEVPVIELPIVPPMAPVIVCEPRVVSEAHIVSEPRVVREPNFVNEDESVIS